MHMLLHAMLSVMEGPGLHCPPAGLTQSIQLTQATPDASAPVMQPHKLQYLILIQPVGDTCISCLIGTMLALHAKLIKVHANALVC